MSKLLLNKRCNNVYNTVEGDTQDKQKSNTSMLPPVSTTEWYLHEK